MKTTRYQLMTMETRPRNKLFACLLLLLAVVTCQAQTINLTNMPSSSVSNNDLIMFGKWSGTKYQWATQPAPNFFATVSPFSSAIYFIAGDSQSSSNAVTGNTNCWPNYFTNALRKMFPGGTYKVYNYSVPGWTMEQQTNAYPITIHTNVNYTDRLNLVLFPVGINNISSSSNDMLAAFNFEAAAAHADGKKIVAFTVPPRATQGTIDQTNYNTLLRSATNWDYLVDWAVIGTLAGTGDGIHPNAIESQLYAREVWFSLLGLKATMSQPDSVSSPATSTNVWIFNHTTNSFGPGGLTVMEAFSDGVNPSIKVMQAPGFGLYIWETNSYGDVYYDCTYAAPQTPAYMHGHIWRMGTTNLGTPYTNAVGGADGNFYIFNSLNAVSPSDGSVMTIFDKSSGLNYLPQSSVVYYPTSSVTTNFLDVSKYRKFRVQVVSTNAFTAQVYLVLSNIVGGVDFGGGVENGGSTTNAVVTISGGAGVLWAAGGAASQVTLAPGQNASWSANTFYTNNVILTRFQVYSQTVYTNQVVIGDGSALTGINSSNLTGQIDNSLLSTNVPKLTNQITGSVCYYDGTNWKPSQNLTWSNMTLTVLSNSVPVATITTNGTLTLSGALSAGSLTIGGSGTPTVLDGVPGFHWTVVGKDRSGVMCCTNPSTTSGVIHFTNTFSAAINPAPLVVLVMPLGANDAAAIRFAVGQVTSTNWTFTSGSTGLPGGTNAFMYFIP